MLRVGLTSPTRWPAIGPAPRSHRCGAGNGLLYQRQRQAYRALQLRPLCLALSLVLGCSASALAAGAEEPPIASVPETALVQAPIPATGLTVGMLLRGASATYPSLRSARLEAQASAQDVVTVERQRWPALSTTLESYSGNTRSTPTRALQLEQTLWDFGRIAARIAEAQTAVDVSVIKVYLQQQDLYLQVIAAWQALLGAQARARAAQETLGRLRDYQAQMRRRVDAEASPRIDLELADARLLQTQVELASAQTNQRVALTRLEQLSGMTNLASYVATLPPIPSLEDTRAFDEQLATMDWTWIASQHAVVAKARAEVRQTRQRLEAKRAENLPQVYLRAYQPLGAVDATGDTSLTTFIGLRYAPGAGFSTFAETQAMATRMASSEQAVETAMREMEQTLRNDREDFENARLRMAALEQSVVGSERVLASYQRQFQAGRKSWQDLLNAVRELAQNQYALADSQAAMLGAMQRLQVRTGQEPQ